jgi:hypothetical protein
MIDTTPDTARLMTVISRWMEAELMTPEFKAYKQKALSLTLWYDDILPPEEVEQIELAPELSRRHDLVIQWMNLHTSVSSLEMLQYYFRRYPFRGTPVRRADHVRMVAEMYFSSFYAIRERAKKFLNELNTHATTSRVDVKAFLKWFDREFDQELRWRNQVHHHRPFEDMALDRLSITELISNHSDPKREGWRRHHLSAYRKFCKDWSDRVAAKSKRMDLLLNEISKAVLEVADFLKPYEATDLT